MKSRITDYAQFPRRPIRPTKEYVASVSALREQDPSEARSIVLILHYYALHKLASGR